jgi:hypothetical protein
MASRGSRGLPTAATGPSRGDAYVTQMLMAEAFVATFKTELVGGRAFRHERLEHETVHWISFYNDEHLHEARRCAAGRVRAIRITRETTSNTLSKPNPRRNVASVEGAATQPAKSQRVRPGLDALGRSGRNLTKRSTSPLDPNRLASLAANAIPASETTRSSSNATRTPSCPTGPSWCTTKVTSGL